MFAFKSHDIETFCKLSQVSVLKSKSHLLMQSAPSVVVALDFYVWSLKH